MLVLVGCECKLFGLVRLVTPTASNAPGCQAIFSGLIGACGLGILTVPNNQLMDLILSASEEEWSRFVHSSTEHI